LASSKAARVKSPFGCLDMAGNLWEWTRSLWGKDASDPELGYPYDPKDLERERLDAAHDLPDCLTEWQHPVWR
jgi:formylglycine-generating enzyme required for sulfatase activity